MPHSVLIASYYYAIIQCGVVGKAYQPVSLCAVTNMRNNHNVVPFGTLNHSL